MWGDYGMKPFWHKMSLWHSLLSSFQLHCSFVELQSSFQPILLESLFTNFQMQQHLIINVALFTTCRPFSGYWSVPAIEGEFEIRLARTTINSSDLSQINVGHITISRSSKGHSTSVRTWLSCSSPFLSY